MRSPRGPSGGRAERGGGPRIEQRATATEATSSGDAQRFRLRQSSRKGAAVTVGYMSDGAPLQVVPTLHGDDSVDCTTVSFLLVQNLKLKKEEEQERRKKEKAEKKEKEKKTQEEADAVIQSLYLKHGLSADAPRRNLLLIPLLAPRNLDIISMILVPAALVRCLGSVFSALLGSSMVTCSVGQFSYFLRERGPRLRGPFSMSVHMEIWIRDELLVPGSTWFRGWVAGGVHTRFRVCVRGFCIAFHTFPT